MSKEKLEKAIIQNKLNSYGVTRKTLYSFGSVLVCIGLVIVLSVTQAIFDTSILFTVAFWVEFAILAGLSIFGMITGQQVGDDMSRNNPKGQFRMSLSRYSNIYQIINSCALFAFFEDWLDNYRERKLKRKIENVLKDAGIKQMEVLDLDLSELEKLKQPYKKSWKDTIYEGKYKGDTTYFLSCSDEQIELIRAALTGKIRVSKLPRSFFMNALNTSEKDMWESAARQGTKKASYMSVNYVYKLLMLLALSVLSAGLTPGLTEGVSAATIWLSLMKRLFCLITAYVWGIYIGHQIVRIDITYLDFKIDILSLYNDEVKTNIYKLKSIEKQAQIEYENMVVIEEQQLKEMEGEEINGEKITN